MPRTVTARYRARRRARHGQALLEFAFVSVVLVVLLSAIVTLGQYLYWAQSLQSAVDSAAQEIARTPFDAEGRLGLGDLTLVGDDNDDSTRPILMFDGKFRDLIYDEKHLVLDEANESDNLPLLNRLLESAMIFDPDLNCRRYPGALVTNPEGALTVLIPVMNDGGTAYRWVAPVEEIVQDGGVRPYALSGDPSALSGIVALRINYPAQSATSLSYVRQGEDHFVPQVADDTDVMIDPMPARYTLSDAAPNPQAFDGRPKVHAGQYGLGQHAALQQAIRPYRKVLSVQAVFRREVFLD